MDGFPLGAPLLEPAVDDGSASDVLLTVRAGRGQIVALDARTGEQLWTADGIPRTEPLLVDRRLITTFGGRLVALDMGTGRRLWSGPEGPEADVHLLTDGRVVLVAELGQAETTFTAVDLTDGRVRWTATGPGEVAGVFAIGRRLIALQQEQMFRLG
jgi:outer membrane protein assembly factor BamB